MKDVSPDFVTALNAARDTGLIVRRFIWLTVKDRETGESEEFGLWTGDDPITTNVISAITGAEVERTFYGDVQLEIGSIARSSDLNIQSVNVSVSQISDLTQQIVREYDTRLATVEINVGLMGADGIPIVAPEVEFLGEINEAGISTPRAGGKGGISFTVVSDAISMLTRRNPRKRSHAGQATRENDQWGRYSNSSAYSRIYWGENPPKGPGTAPSAPAIGVAPGYTGQETR